MEDQILLMVGMMPIIWKWVMVMTKHMVIKVTIKFWARLAMMISMEVKATTGSQEVTEMMTSMVVKVMMKS